MSARHRILFQSNPLHLRTGLAENGRTLLAYLYKRGYDIAHLATQGTMANDPKLALMPWRTYGAIPPDQEVINRINGDPLFGRDASYGALAIDGAVADWKPTIWIGSDDLWSFPLAAYADKPWYKRVHGLHHITVDSIPVLDQAYEQAKRSKHYLTWAPFAAREMRRVGGAAMSHVQSIYGAMDTGLFSPITPKERDDLRKQFGITPDTFVFLYVFRNQLRKSANTILEAYARFRAEHPGVKAILHFHTAFHEKGQGWDLPRMAAYYGVKPQELFCTYVCKKCGSWSVATFQGEDLKCPMCGEEKGLSTASIVHGVPGHQMRFIYGISDACLSAFTSGGQEYHSVQSLLCGKPLACTSYSCGEDFCTPDTEGFVYPITWHPYHEPGTNFIKAANDMGSITTFMRRMVKSSARERQAAGEAAREWATKTFGIDAIGAQWERLFDTLPVNPEWSSVEVAAKTPPKNPAYQPPDIGDNAAWLKDIYKGVLLMDVADGDAGLGDWLRGLAAGQTRETILAYFRQVAADENAKLGYATGGTAGASTDFGSLLDTTGRQRGLMLVKESIGDICMVTALFESFHQQHPDTDLYVAIDPRYAEVLAGNEHVHKVLPYIPAMENELLMVGQAKTPRYFNVYYHVCVQSQRVLSYLSQPEPVFNLTLLAPSLSLASS
jgi:hypothetical protein